MPSWLPGRTRARYAVMRMTDADSSPRGPDDFALTRRELALVAAFWACYAVLMVAARVFDAGPGPAPGWRSGPVVTTAAEALCWALLTPVIFRMAGRLGEGKRPAVSLAVFAAVGLGIATLLSLGGDAIRDAFPPPGPPPGRPHRGPPIWFGFLNALVIYAGVLAAGLARAYSLRFRARREQATELQAQLAEAQLDALRRQLDPHFLFNTLNAISSLVERDPRGVRRMIARLSELLRYSLEGADDPEIALRQELELLGRYLDIMQVRFGARLEVVQRVDEAALDALVPALVLQPLVENAIRHGIEKLEGGGRVAIEATVEAHSLVLRVRDNGPGSVSARDGRPGVGLNNTRARLERLYGMDQHFALAPLPEGGTLAEVRLPLRRVGVARAG
jgi:two-component system, LytTR family, sensor kinase